MDALAHYFSCHKLHGSRARSGRRRERSGADALAFWLRSERPARHGATRGWSALTVAYWLYRSLRAKWRKRGAVDARPAHWCRCSLSYRRGSLGRLCYVRLLARRRPCAERGPRNSRMRNWSEKMRFMSEKMLAEKTSCRQRGRQAARALALSIARLLRPVVLQLPGAAPAATAHVGRAWGAASPAPLGRFSCAAGALLGRRAEIPRSELVVVCALCNACCGRDPASRSARARAPAASPATARGRRLGAAPPVPRRSVFGGGAHGAGQGARAPRPPAAPGLRRRARRPRHARCPGRRPRRGATCGGRAGGGPGAWGRVKSGVKRCYNRGCYLSRPPSRIDPLHALFQPTR